MAEIKLYKSPLKAIKMIALSSIFVCSGIWGLMNGAMPTLISWLCIGFFGLGWPIGLFSLFDRRPQIILNEVGIFDRTVHKDFINWEIIKDAYLIDIYKQHFICLVVDEQFKPSRKMGKIYRGVAKLNEFIGAQELNINIAQINSNPKKLTELILAMRTAKKTNKNELLRNALKERF